MSALDDADARWRQIAEQRPWFGQLAFLGRGPDYFCDLAFAPSDGERVYMVTRHFDLPGYRHYGPLTGACPLHSRDDCTFDMYIDSNSYDKIVANIEQRAATNVWMYNSITVCGPALQLERGYGGRFHDGCAAAETLLVRALARHPNLTLTAWAIWAGGQGYYRQELGAGDTTDDLLHYLDTAQML